MSLADSLEPLTWDAAYSLVATDVSDLPLEELGEICIELEQKISAAAIVILLTKADTDGFLHNLIRAATIWGRYLERCHTEDRGTDDHNFCLGVIAPVLDALAAREFALATRLYELSPSQFRPRNELESDYCYGRVLRGLHTGAMATPEMTSLLDRCAETGDKLSSARVDLCRILLEHDQVAFDESFAALVAAREKEIQACRQRGQVESVPVLAHRELFVEGVALLNLAERLGFILADDYPLCPSISRLPMSKPFPGVR